MAISENEPVLKETTVEKEGSRLLGLSAYEQMLQEEWINSPNQPHFVGATAYEQSMARQRRSLEVTPVVATPTEASEGGNR